LDEFPARKFLEQALEQMEILADAAKSAKAIAADLSAQEALLDIYEAR
jgi:type VI secretion system secreted protein VgrG